MRAYLENIVYNELLVQGYDVSVGNIQNGEVDFIATKENNIEYYQVTYTILIDEVIEREFGANKNVDDNYPKYVISTDTFDMSQNGVIHKNIINWLLNK